MTRLSATLKTRTSLWLRVGGTLKEVPRCETLLTLRVSWQQHHTVSLRGLLNARLPFDGFGNVSTNEPGHVVMANLWLDLTKSEDIPNEAVANATMLVLLDSIDV
jgi:hypothetical protein